MRNVVLGIAALAAVGFVLPVASASAQSVVIKTDSGRHEGWRHRHHKKVVVIKHHRHHDRHAVVIHRD